MSGVYHQASISSAKDAIEVAPSDATIIPVTRIGLYIGTGGDLVVRMALSGNQVTFSNVAQGVLPVQVDMIYSTNTTASGILALY